MKSENQVTGYREVGKENAEVFKGKHFRMRLRLGLSCG